MKASLFNFQYFRGRLTGLLAAASTAGAALTSYALTTVDSPTGAMPQAGTSKGVVLSPGALDVLRMVQAKVSPQVITAYVKSSVTSFNLSANDIIVLRHLGVTDEVLAAMLERSGELRAQSAPAGPAYATAATPGQPPAVPADATAGALPPDHTYAAGTTPDDYGYGDSYSYAGYYPYPYYSYYPYTYGYSYPIYYPYWGCSYGYCGYHGCYHSYPGRCYYNHGSFGHGYPGFHSSQAVSSRLYSGPTFTGPRRIYSGPTFAGPNNLMRNVPMNHFAVHSMPAGGLAMRSAAVTRSASATGAVRGGGGHR